MKKIFKILLLALLVSTGITRSDEAKSQTGSVSFSVFYSSLKPYGRWVSHPSYGQIWVSNTRDFKPYSTGGHWAYTDYGWTWVSDYDWGWAPFHYGRWAYESSYGWYWVPGYEWAPAWVAWRGGGDYYGWAPLSPGLNISVGVSFGNSIPYDRWVFAPHRYITSPYVSRYYVPRSRNVTIIKNTTVVNNVTVKNNVHYVAGPRKEDVERVNHTRVQTYTVSNASKPGKTVVNNNTVNVYRPVINNEKTTVNNTTVNKNSNNTTVNKNSNNVEKNNNNTAVTNENKSTVTKNRNNKTATNSKATTTNKQTNKTTNETVNKKPVNNSVSLNDKTRAKALHDSSVAKTEAAQHKQQLQRAKNEVAKRKNNSQNNNNNNNNDRRK